MEELEFYRTSDDTIWLYLPETKTWVEFSTEPEE